MIRKLAIAALLFVAPFGAAANDVAQAKADRDRFSPADWPYLYYVTTEPVAIEGRAAVATALHLVVPSMAPQQVTLARCLPAPVGPTLWRLDLRELGWDWRAWADVIARDPYAPTADYILHRGDWLLLQLTDAHDSDAYYRLVFGGANGGKAPATRDEALATLGVSTDARLQFGLIEGESGVSVQGVRLIRNLSAQRGYAWGTQDVLKLSADQDPLEQPEGDFKHDGEEWIIGCRKQAFDPETKAIVQGALQAYFLANGEGKIVDRAPVDLVADHTHFRGLDEIRVAGSCIQCHADGLNEFKQNAFRAVLESGVEALATYEDRDRLEAFHFADVDKARGRDNEDFAAIVRPACGCEPAQAVASYQAAINAYDAPLDLADVARELETTADKLALSIAWANARGILLGARIASLVHGGTIPRRAMEGAYHTLETVLAQWEAAT